MNYSLIVYVLVSMVTISGCFYLNFASGRSTQAILLSIGILLLSVLFGLRWFSKATMSTNGAWPPALNSCPDYLTLTKVNNVFTCIDAIGVSQSGGNSQGMKVMTDTFDLALNLSGVARVNALCANAKKAGVTWEGVWDGSVCLNKEPPAPV
jgi:hypothetical protein